MSSATDKPKKNLGYRVPHGTYEEFEEWREEQGYKKSEAGRRLLESGLEAEKQSASEERLETAEQTDGTWIYEFLLQLSSVSAFGAIAVGLASIVGLLGAGVGLLFLAGLFALSIVALAGAMRSS